MQNGARAPSTVPLPAQQALFTVYKGITLVYADLQQDLQRLADAVGNPMSREPPTLLDDSLDSDGSSRLNELLLTWQDAITQLRADAQRASTTAVGTQTSPWQPKVLPCQSCPELATAATTAEKTAASLQQQLETLQEAAKKAQQRLGSKVSVGCLSRPSPVLSGWSLDRVGSAIQSQTGRRGK